MKNLLLIILLSVFVCSCGGGGSSGNPPDDEVQINPVVTSNIKIDQFGYTPSMRKIAVISSPQQGYNSDSSFSPGTNYEVRSADGQLALSGSLTVFNGGSTDIFSGDKIWYFDFSALDQTGEYYIYDADKNLSSDTFTISSGVYDDVLAAALKTFYYQRVSFDKTAEYAGANWADGASHIGAEQDTDCRLMVSANPESSDASTSKDLSGGWYDAGDYNKYVNFADGTLHNLLFAYQESPESFTDAVGIPESGNGTPDIIDEIKYELDWLLKMQTADGSVLHKIASISWDSATPPSTDTVRRRYAPATASATVSFAGAMAHAAIVFTEFDAAYAVVLRSAAENAWDWLQLNSGAVPSSFDNAGFVNADAEDSASDQLENMLCASIYLYLLTGSAEYHDYLKANISDALMMTDDGWMNYDGTDEEAQNALVYYADSTGADSTLAEDIRSRYVTLGESEFNDFAPIYRAENRSDGYLGYLDTYYWGSNRAKAQAGSSLYNITQYEVASGTGFEDDAFGYLHYLHGVNPNNIVYLSNMNGYGALNSVDEFYHLWYTDGSDWDNVNDSFGPPPGYVVGGANENYDMAGVYIGGVAVSLYQVMNQPPSKSYKTWNDADEESYRITENSITYQAAYIRLLSKYK